MLDCLVWGQSFHKAFWALAVWRVRRSFPLIEPQKKKKFTSMPHAEMLSSHRTGLIIFVTKRAKSKVMHLRFISRLFFNSKASPWHCESSDECFISCLKCLNKTCDEMSLATPSPTTNPDSNWKQETTPRETQQVTPTATVPEKWWLGSKVRLQTEGRNLCLPWQFAAVQYSAWWTLPCSVRRQ